MSLIEFTALVCMYNVMTLSNGAVMIALLKREVVESRHLLSIDQLLFAFTVGRVTPGPASAYVASIGYMIFGVGGALAATIAIALPGYLMLPLVRGYSKLARWRPARGFTTGLVAAQVGLIFAASMRIGVEAIRSIEGVAVFGVALVASFLIGKRPPALALGIASAVGVVIHLAEHR